MIRVDQAFSARLAPLGGVLATVLTLGQPALLSTGYILHRWAAVAADVEIPVRAILLLAALSLALLLVLRLLIGAWPTAIILADAAVLFTVREIGMALIAVIALFAWALLRVIRRALGRPTDMSSIRWATVRATGIFSLITVLFATAAAGAARTRPDFTAAMPAYQLDASDRPNIYVVLLDGYPRADTLRDQFSIDNRSFLEGLEARGFAVSEGARTNYNKTWLTVGSMLNGTYIDDLLTEHRPPSDPTAQLRWLNALINQASIPRALTKVGYTVRTIAPPYDSATLATADEVITDAAPDAFEVAMITLSPWTTLFRDQVGGLMARAQADRVTDGLDAAVAVARSPVSPQFVLAHIYSPHAPFVLGQDPGRTEGPECFPLGCSFFEVRLERMEISLAEYRDRVDRQISTLNELVLEALDGLVAADPGAVVIVMSDHGLRYSVEDAAEQYRSLLAARTPGHPSLFARDESPVNVLRVVLDTYLGADLAPRPYRAWRMDWSQNIPTETPITEQMGRSDQ